MLLLLGLHVGCIRRLVALLVFSQLKVVSLELLCAHQGVCLLRFRWPPVIICRFAHALVGLEVCAEPEVGRSEIIFGFFR